MAERTRSIPQAYTAAPHQRVLYGVLLPAGCGWAAYEVFKENLSTGHGDITTWICLILFVLGAVVVTPSWLTIPATTTVDEIGVRTTLLGVVVQGADWTQIRSFTRLTLRGLETIQINLKAGQRARGVLAGFTLSLKMVEDIGHLKGLLTRLAKEKDIALTSKDPVKRFLPPHEYEMLRHDGLPVEWL